MRLSQTVVYAVHAVLRLAEVSPGTLVSCKELAEKSHMPERYLLQILRDLSKKGILSSTRGGNGGFVLQRRPNEITLLEAIEAIDGPLVASLPMKSGFPDPAGERVQAALQSIAESVRSRLDAVKFSDLTEAPADENSPSKKPKKKGKG